MSTEVIGWIERYEDGRVVKAKVVVERDADGTLTSIYQLTEGQNTELEVGTNDGSST